MLVDDEVDVAQSFSLAFQNDGFIVDTYNDPIKALSNFKTDLYDLALLDIRLPSMDGFELYEKIRDVDRSQGLLHERISNELFGSKRTRLTN